MKRLLFLLVALAGCDGREEVPTEEVVPTDEVIDGVSLSDDVVPIISTECGFCHTRQDPPNPAATLNGVYYETAQDLLDKVGGPIVAGSATDSRLIDILRQDLAVGSGPTLMPPPPSGRPPVGEADIAIVAEWIDQGAEDD